MNTLFLFIAFILSAAVPVPAQEHSTIKAEPNLEKRSELALIEADKVVTQAKAAYENQKTREFQEKLAEVRDLADLSYRSLKDSGKIARKNPKYFKRAEIKLRALMRRLDTLSSDVSVDDRPPVDSTKQSLSEMHDRIAQALMAKEAGL